MNEREVKRQEPYHNSFRELSRTVRNSTDTTSLTSTIDVLKTIRITFLMRNKEVRKAVTSEDEHGINAMKILGIENVN